MESYLIGGEETTVVTVSAAGLQAFQKLAVEVFLELRHLDGDDELAFGLQIFGQLGEVLGERGEGGGACVCMCVCVCVCVCV